jgi:putative toxin-antitoxin system antitoxin component (TIGR02293 family)
MELFWNKRKKVFFKKEKVLPLLKGKVMSAKAKYHFSEDSALVVNDSAAIYMRVTEPSSRNYLKIFDELIDLSDIIISNWLNITTRTLRNYRKAKDVQLKDNTKEHIITILALYKHGMEVFESKSEFEKWLSTKNILLDNRAPMDFLDTISGIQLIDNRLTAMEFGENA